MKTETTRNRDYATVKTLVREWLMEKGVALTGVNGEASRSSVNRFKLDLQRRIVDALNAERDRAAGITTDILPIGADDCYWCERVRRAVAEIRGSNQ